MVMKKNFYIALIGFAILVSSFLSSCSLFRSNDERFSIDNRLYVLRTPNPNLLSGIFINRLDPSHDTLVLAAPTEFVLFSSSENHIFFILTRDSLDQPTIFRGTWEYRPASYEGGDSTGYLYLKRSNLNTEWTCRLYLQDSTDRLKRLVIKDFFERKIKVDPLDKVLGTPQIKYYPATQKQNSRGRPFQFEKVILLEK